jgi:hypothetical protein
MSVALVSSSAPQPRDRGHIYDGSWPFRESKDGPPTRIVSNCCNRVTARQSLAVKIASPASPQSATLSAARTSLPLWRWPPPRCRPQRRRATRPWREGSKWTTVPIPYQLPFSPTVKIPIKFLILLRCRLRDSNPRPRDYKSRALPAELSRRAIRGRLLTDGSLESAEVALS